jgi:hypothetical protein
MGGGGNRDIATIFPKRRPTPPPRFQGFDTAKRSGRGSAMSSVGWAILLVGVGLAAEVAWTEYRQWKRRTPHGRLMAHFGWTGFSVERFRGSRHQ